MSRLATRFGQLKSQQRKALVSYVMAGDPHPEVTVPLLHQMVDAGVDVIELGLPFSDPMADGPVIALAAERAGRWHQYPRCTAHGERISLERPRNTSGTHGLPQSG